MKKLLLSLLMVAALQSSNADTNQVSQLFSAKEVQLDLSGVKKLSGSGNSWAGNVGMNYFVTRNLGVGVDTTVNTSGATFNNVGGSVIMRLPIEHLRVSPYAVVGAQRNFSVNQWGYKVGGGLEYRLNQKWGVFGEYQYLFREGRDSQLVKAGLRLVF